jgi:hypothetical protein
MKRNPSVEITITIGKLQFEGFLDGSDGRAVVSFAER